MSWSNTKNKGDIINIEVEELLNKSSLLNSLKTISKEVYSKFTWTQDNFEELFDCMRTPARCYSDYKQGALNDDCDGFHACIMQICKASNIDCVLLTYMVPDLNQCHTILVAKYNNSYYKVDYKNVTKFSTLDALIARIKTLHPDLIDYNMVKFDTKYYVVKDF